MVRIVHKVSSLGLRLRLRFRLHSPMWFLWLGYPVSRLGSQVSSERNWNSRGTERFEM